ncbi:MAG: GGDEF domain-containing protein [Nitrospirae bacterium]|nr:GGDEF domain-containing protein [Nitrospirota bacterium]
MEQHQAAEAKNPGDIARLTLQDLAREKKAPTPFNYARIYARHAGIHSDSLLEKIFDLLEIFSRIDEDGWTAKQVEEARNFLPRTIFLTENGIDVTMDRILDETITRSKTFAHEIQLRKFEINQTVTQLNEIIGQAHLLINKTSVHLEKNLERFKTVKSLEEARPIFLDIVEQSRTLLDRFRAIGEEFQEAHKRLMSPTIEANLDPLTGTLNRRGFQKRIEASIGLEIVLLIFDLDHFKELNDRQGHHQGDLVLKRVAGVVNASLDGANAIFSRWGGDEFLLLFPRKSLEEIVSLAEEIRIRIEQDGIGVQPEADNPGRGMTISIGISAGRLSSEEIFDRFYNLADQALYLAKKEGRNRTRAIHLDDAR